MQQYNFKRSKTFQPSGKAWAWHSHEPKFEPWEGSVGDIPDLGSVLVLGQGLVGVWTGTVQRAGPGRRGLVGAAQLDVRIPRERVCELSCRSKKYI